MNGHVHYTLTRRWARQAGMSEAHAETVARWDVATDRIYPGRQRAFLRYHFASRGAETLAEAYLRRAVRTGDIRYLGVALHCAQDAVSHGRLGRLLHWPGIDIWQRRSGRVRTRLEARSKDMVRDYLSSRPAGGPGGQREAGDDLPDLPVDLPPDLPSVSR